MPAWQFRNRDTPTIYRLGVLIRQIQGLDNRPPDVILATFSAAVAALIRGTICTHKSWKCSLA